MSIEEIRALKENFFKETSPEARAALARKAINKAGTLVRNEVGWAINYDAVHAMEDIGHLSLPNKITAAYLQQIVPKIEAAADDIKQIILARLLTSFAPNSLVMELGLSLGAVIDGKTSSLLEPPAGKRLGTIELWTYRGMAVAHIAYLTALGHTSESATRTVAEAFAEKVVAVENWNRRSKRPSEIDNKQIDLLIKEARAEGKKYKALQIKDAQSDSPNYGIRQMTETGLQYALACKRVHAQQRKKQKKGK